MNDVMTEREQLRSLIDRLPAGEVHSALRYMEYLVELGEDPVARALRDAPVDDEPLDTEELKEIKEALADVAAGRVFSHQDVLESFRGDG
jgi:NTP pyrophosphatase (non-canonical NTP hydrolase)